MRRRMSLRLISTSSAAPPDIPEMSGRGGTVA
jgi:hypothetical protein